MQNTYTLNQVASMTGLSTRTIRNYLKSGLAQGEKINGVWLFSEEEFENLITNPAIKPAIKARSNSIIFDFVADSKKRSNKICSILDFCADDSESEKISQFFCDTINNNYNCDPIDLVFKFEKYGDNVRVILSGDEDVVSDILNKYYA